jgi:hypothetical protein
MKPTIGSVRSICAIAARISGINVCGDTVLRT